MGCSRVTKNDDASGLGVSAEDILVRTSGVTTVDTIAVVIN